MVGAGRFSRACREQLSAWHWNLRRLRDARRSSSPTTNFRHEAHRTVAHPLQRATRCRHVRPAVNIRTDQRIRTDGLASADRPPSHARSHGVAHSLGRSRDVVSAPMRRDGARSRRALCELAAQGLVRKSSLGQGAVLLGCGRDRAVRVRIEGLWWDVPEDAVVAGPNRAGRTMVWPVYYRQLDKVLRIEVRCFLPGSMT